MSSMGHALRHLGGQGPIEVLTRVRDFNIQTVEGPDGKAVTVPADTLVAFTAQAFRELSNADGGDVWEFQTMMPTAGGPARAMIYLRGEDLFMVRALSKVL